MIEVSVVVVDLILIFFLIPGEGKLYRTCINDRYGGDCGALMVGRHLRR